MAADIVTSTAIERAGGSKALAKVLGVTRQAVEDWQRVPPKHVLMVEKLSGVSRYELRPDIYGERPRPLPQSKSVAA